jgi:hypothetical protein
LTYFAFILEQKEQNTWYINSNIIQSYIHDAYKYPSHLEGKMQIVLGFEALINNTIYS